jgi:Peptidase family M28
LWLGVISGGQLLYYRMVSRPQTTESSTTRRSPYAFFPFLLAWALVIIVAVIAVKALKAPAPLSANAPQSEFSAYRAIAHVREIARVPHPLGTDADAAVKKYLIAELSALGVQTSVFSDTAINASGPMVIAGQVNDIVGLLPGTAPGPSILLMAHYDSVPRAPGAGDDGSGVATILEIIRALHAGPRLQRDIIILFTDGEEEGLLGAEAFAHSHPLMANIGLFLNFEARGNRGPSLLFETSIGNADLIDAVAHVVPHPIGSSLFYALYKQLPNDTDFTVFRPFKIPGLNFAFGEGLDAYHSPLDTPDNLSLASLQHDGSYGLALVRYFGQLDLTTLRQQHQDDVFFDWFGGRLIAYRERWVLPGEILLTLLWVICIVQAFRKRQASFSALVVCFASAILVLILVSITAGVGWWIISRVLGSRRIITDCSANVFLLSGLMLLGACAATPMISWLGRKFKAHEICLAALALCLVLSWFLALGLPSGNYLLFWPLLLALLGYVSASRSGSGSALCVADIPATACSVLLFAPFAYLLYVFLTLQLISVIACAVLLGLFLLISFPFFAPCLATPLRWTSGILAIAALACIIPGVVLSGYGPERPRPDNIQYSLNADDNSAAWITYDRQTDSWTSQFLPRAVSKTQPVQKYLAGFSRPLISAPAPALPLAPPIAEVVGQEDRGDGSHMLKLKMKSNRNAEALFLRFVVPIRLASMKLAGRNVAPAEGQINGLNLYAMGEQGVDLELVSSSPSINFWLMDRSDGLPVKASQRPAGLIAQNPSDVTFVCRKYSFPISDSQNPH